MCFLDFFELGTCAIHLAGMRYFDLSGGCVGSPPRGGENRFRIYKHRLAKSRMSRAVSMLIYRYAYISECLYIPRDCTHAYAFPVSAQRRGRGGPAPSSELSPGLARELAAQWMSRTGKPQPELAPQRMLTPQTDHRLNILASSQLSLIS